MTFGRHVFWYEIILFSLYLFEIFLDSTEFYRDSIINLYMFSCKVPIIFFRFKQNVIF
jgi:hypothetical protein